MKYISLSLFLFFIVFFIQNTHAQCESSYDNDILCYSWYINNVNTSSYFNNALYNVQGASVVYLNGKQYMNVNASGIPQYDHIITSSDVSWLNSRPKASQDFTTGKTTASVGEEIQFGESIGYANSHCSLGYWPPGPECPEDTSKSVYFPMEYSKSADTCYTTLGEIGFWVNGVSVYNWWDGTSYDNDGVWHTMAAWGEYYDLDLCSGHAANGDYHHHTYPNCLADILSDNGNQKSPIYGFAADGIPILGPWVSSGVLAKSCWQNRDYDNANSETGCGTPYKRSCLLVDQYDVSKGTETTSNQGPDTNSYVSTQSGNSIQANSGFYFEDHYYNSTCTEQGDQYLDQYNGRFDSEYGYVYQITIDNLDNPEFVKSVFPHFVGPTFYGELDSNTIAQCTTTPFSGPQGGGGSGPPTGPPGGPPGFHL